MIYLGEFYVGRYYHVISRFNHVISHDSILTNHMVDAGSTGSLSWLPHLAMSCSKDQVTLLGQFTLIEQS